MNDSSKTALLWGVSAWLCAMSCLNTAWLWRHEPLGLALLSTVGWAVMVSFVWLEDDGTGWPALAGWGFLAWETMAIMVVLVLS